MRSRCRRANSSGGQRNRTVISQQYQEMRTRNEFGSEVLVEEVGSVKGDRHTWPGRLMSELSR